MNGGSVGSTSRGKADLSAAFHATHRADDDDTDVPPPPYEESCHSAQSDPFKQVDKVSKTSSHAEGGPSSLNDKIAAGPSTAPSPYAPLPDPSSPSSSDHGAGTSVRAKSVNDSSSAHDLPAPFGRPPPRTLSYAPFEPIALFSVSSELEKGFPPLPPPSSITPHPFTSHDVNEQDWIGLLNDVKAAAAAAPVSKVVSGVAPIADHIPIPLAGMLVSKGIAMHLNSRKKGPVGDAIEHWNRYFFHPRRMHVVLAQGKICYSGPEVPPPDMVRTDLSSGEYVMQYSDNEDDADNDVFIMVDGVLQKQKSLKAAWKHQRQRRRDWSKSAGQRWRLVVSFKDYVL